MPAGDVAAGDVAAGAVPPPAAAAGGETLPPWLADLARAVAGAPAGAFSRFLPPPDASRHSAVLILFGPHRVPTDSAADADVLLIERAATLRTHAGQPAFPGGLRDPGEDYPVGTALREAAEETGLDPAGVVVAGVLPALWLPPSATVVTGVLAWWAAPGPVGPVDPGEVAAVERVPVDWLADPARRRRVTHPSGYTGPAFAVADLLVWGFTAGLLDRLLDLLGLGATPAAAAAAPLVALPASGAATVLS